MLDRFKEKYYRTRYGPERAALILRVEQELAGLSAQDFDPKWMDWLWSLPPEAWREAIARRRAQTELVAGRERVIEVITRKNKLLMMIREAEEAGRQAEIERLRPMVDAAMAEAERLKAEVRLTEARYRDLSLNFRERFGSAPSRKAPEESDVALDRRADRWDEWIISLPSERRDEGWAVRDLDAERTGLRKLLIREVIHMDELQAEGGESDETGLFQRRIASLKAKHEAVEAQYRQTGSQLFATYGEPDLTECAPST